MAVAMLCVASKIRPMMGVKMAPPMTAITIREPPTFVLGPSAFESQRENCGEHERHEKAGEE